MERPGLATVEREFSENNALRGKEQNPPSLITYFVMGQIRSCREFM